MSDEPGIARRARAEYSPTAGVEPAPAQPASGERFGWRFQTGDKVIQTENDYDKDVFNGDIGTIERIDPA